MSKEKSKVAVKRGRSAPTSTDGEGLSPLLSLRTEIDRLFDDFGAGLWDRPMAGRFRALFPESSGRDVLPAMEIVEREGEFRITAELPGIAPNDVEVRLTDGMISIRGEKSEEERDEKGDYLVSERRYGAFHRTLVVPSGIDSDAVTASFANGVLTVTMPKTAEAKHKERKIEVRAA